MSSSKKQQPSLLKKTLTRSSTGSGNTSKEENQLSVNSPPTSPSSSSSSPSSSPAAHFFQQPSSTPSQQHHTPDIQIFFATNPPSANSATTGNANSSEQYPTFRAPLVANTNIGNVMTFGGLGGAATAVAATSISSSSSSSSQLSTASSGSVFNSTATLSANASASASQLSTSSRSSVGRYTPGNNISSSQTSLLCNESLLREKESMLNYLKSLDLTKYSFPNETKPKTDYTYARTSSYLSDASQADDENCQMPNLCRRARKSPSQVAREEAAAAKANASSGGHWSLITNLFSAKKKQQQQQPRHSANNNSDSPSGQQPDELTNSQLSVEAERSKQRVDYLHSLSTMLTSGGDGTGGGGGGGGGASGEPVMRLFSNEADDAADDNNNPPSTQITSKLTIQQQQHTSPSAMLAARRQQQRTPPRGAGAWSTSPNASASTSCRPLLLAAAVACLLLALLLAFNNTTTSSRSVEHAGIESESGSDANDKCEYVNWWPPNMKAFVRYAAYVHKEYTSAYVNSDTFGKCGELARVIALRSLETAWSAWSEMWRWSKWGVEWTMSAMRGVGEEVRDKTAEAAEEWSHAYSSLVHQLQLIKERIISSHAATRAKSGDESDMSDSSVSSSSSSSSSSSVDLEAIRGQLDRELNQTVAQIMARFEAFKTTHEREMQQMKAIVDRLAAGNLADMIGQQRHDSTSGNEEASSSSPSGQRVHKEHKHQQNATASGADHVHGGDVDDVDKEILFEKITEYIDKTFFQYNADKTGMTDFAAESVGGSVLFTRCTENYEHNSRWWSILNVPISRISASPRVILQGPIQPGHCWAFKGDKADVFIKLTTRIIPKSFSIEHIAKEVSISGNIDTAPHNFTVYGFEDPGNISDENRLLLGHFVYDNTSKVTLQFFEVQYEYPGKPIHAVELKIESNAGNPEYTCLYKFRVHGQLFKPSEKATIGTETQGDTSSTPSEDSESTKASDQQHN